MLLSIGNIFGRDSIYVKLCYSCSKYSKQANDSDGPKGTVNFNLRQEVKLLRLENDFLRQQLSIHNGGVVPSSPYTSGRSEIGTP